MEKIKRYGGILLIIAVVGLAIVLFTQANGPSPVSASSSPLIIKTGDVSGIGIGMDTGEFKVTGLGTATTAYVLITAFKFNFDSEDHHIDEVGVYLQKAIPGGWQWTVSLPVKGGVAHGRFLAYYNDKNDDDGFSWKVQYTMIAQ